MKPKRMWTRSCEFFFRAKRYAVVETYLAADRERGRALSRFEAQTVLTESLRFSDGCGPLRVLYTALSHSASITHVSNDQVARWLLRELHDGFGGSLAVVELDGVRASEPSSATEPAWVARVRQIDALLSQLGTADVPHRGHGYRVLRAVMQRSLREREAYEAVTPHEARAVLGELADDGRRSPAQWAALARIADLFDAPEKGEELELVVLRRLRASVHGTVETGPAITPSELRKVLERHWLAVETLDEDERPVAGVALEVVLPDGDSRRLRTDEDGMARLEPVTAGSAKICVVELDGRAWRAVGGASAVPTGREGPSRTHRVRQGECLSRIARKYGFAWEAVWDDDRNASLRERRKSPHTLLAGDVLALPRAQLYELTRPVDAVHRIQIARGAEHEVRLRLQDAAGTGLTGLEYELSFEHAGKRETRPGCAQTDDGGALIENLPVGVEMVEVRFKRPKLAFALAVGGLDPAQDARESLPVASGAQARLQGLGYAACGQAGTTAIERFQREQLGADAASGELDARTCDRLETLYGV